MRYCLDTNILVYVADPSAGEKHRIARTVADRIKPGQCVVTLQTLGELFRVLTIKQRMSTADARNWVQDWRSNATIVAADESCLADAMEAVEAHRWSFWDAMIWATARKAGCRLLLTEDGQADRELGGVTLINPFLPNPSPLLLEALGPLA